MSESSKEQGGDDVEEMTFGEKVWEQVSTLGLAILGLLGVRRPRGFATP